MIRGCSRPYHHGHSYPSGILALVVVVPDRNGRVCIVLDDCSAPSQPVRAVFQSDGRAVCYHSNGNMWLALNRSGGQCLSDAGARTCQWSWGSVSLTRTLFHPVFLSLNKTVGVRVLGNKKVFVSFLAKGQQAKFNVGSCCTLGEHKTPGLRSSVPKEELQVLAAKIRIHMTLKHLQQCLRTPFQPRVPKSILTPQLHAAAWRLLNSADVTLTTSDREFIHRCLKDS
ncbi:glutamate-rich protein 6 [Odontesthes bonariensis]